MVSLATVVNLIGRTTTKKGLRVRSEIDKGAYPKGVAVTDERMEAFSSRPMSSRGLELHVPAHIGQP